jgi:hypothetical protein
MPVTWRAATVVYVQVTVGWYRHMAGCNSGLRAGDGCAVNSDANGNAAKRIARNVQNKRKMLRNSGKEYISRKWKVDRSRKFENMEQCCQGQHTVRLLTISEDTENFIR